MATTTIVLYITIYLLGVVISSAFYYRYTATWNGGDKFVGSVFWPIVFPMWASFRFGQWLGENFIPNNYSVMKKMIQCKIIKWRE